MIQGQEHVPLNSHRFYMMSQSSRHHPLPLKNTSLHHCKGEAKDNRCGQWNMDHFLLNAASLDAGKKKHSEMVKLKTKVTLNVAFNTVHIHSAQMAIKISLKLKRCSLGGELTTVGRATWHSLGDIQLNRLY